MKEIGERLRTLREGIKYSQAKMAEIMGAQQSSINRYEKNLVDPPAEILLRYADYFDVSMDYIYGRTDKPQGTLYEYKPKIQPENAQLRQFIEMCFDPGSPMSDRLKETLYAMMVQEDKK